MFESVEKYVYIDTRECLNTHPVHLEKSKCVHEKVKQDAKATMRSLSMIVFGINSLLVYTEIPNKSLDRNIQAVTHNAISVQHTKWEL